MEIFNSILSIIKTIQLRDIVDILAIALLIFGILDIKGNYRNAVIFLRHFGVFSMIASQTIVNIGMVLGFLPVVGITLPLFSSGGTSALSTLISLGLVQSVRYHNLRTSNRDCQNCKGFCISRA